MGWENFLPSVDIGNHILGVFHRQSELKYAFPFLKNGFDNDEAVMLLTDYISKEQFCKKIQNDWKVNNIQDLENQKIFFMTQQDWYFPDDVFYAEKTIERWNRQTKQILKNGFKGLRVFADMSYFFKRGLAAKVLEYESMLEKKFLIPFTVVCAYTYEDLGNQPVSYITDMAKHHQPIWDEKEDFTRRIIDSVNKDQGHTEKLSE